MKDEKLNAIVCSFEELWSKLGGSVRFGLDELVKMIAVQDDDDKDFYIHHRDATYVVRKEKIREYFITHEKPIPPMTSKQELIYLREKVAQLEREAKERMGQEKPFKDVSPESIEPLQETEPKMEVDPAASTVIPPRDESIPPPSDRKKKSLKEIQAELAQDLKHNKGVKPKLGATAVPKDIPRAPE